MEIYELVEQAHRQATSSGFYGIDGKDKRNIAECLALIHSEISEALEELRDPQFLHLFQMGFTREKKPIGFPIELADAVIRIADLCGYLGIDLQTAIEKKMIYNATRPMKHGKKF